MTYSLDIEHIPSPSIQNKSQLVQCPLCTGARQETLLSYYYKVLTQCGGDSILLF